MAVEVSEKKIVEGDAVLDRTVDREPISVFVICHNEEANIRDCLQSISFCDEVVVVDSYSSDNTVSIAKSFNVHVIQREWPGFKNQKAFALNCVKHEWVLNLDADERVSDELRESILAVLRNEWRKKERAAVSRRNDEIVGYYVSRVVYYLGRWWRSGGWYPEYRLRFFQKSAVTWGGVDPHEKPIVKGKTATLNGELYHFTYQHMDDHFQRLQRYSSLAAREEFERGSEVHVRQLVANPFFRFFKFFVLKKGYREGMAGFIVAVTEAYYTFMKYAKLWELHFIKTRAGEDKGADGQE